MTPRLNTIGRLLVAAALAVGLSAPFAGARAEEPLPEMHVYKSAYCGCCTAWTDIVRKAGFKVTVTNTEELTRVKRQAGVPEALEACHTATIGGYVVEGHVPVAAIEKLLQERPQIRGIAVRGMPDGSPGMGDDPDARYDVVTFGAPSSASDVFFRVGN